MDHEEFFRKATESLSPYISTTTALHGQGGVWRTCHIDSASAIDRSYISFLPEEHHDE